MFCPKCGTQNPETGKFCRTCGTDLGNVSAALSGNLPASITDAGVAEIHYRHKRRQDPHEVQGDALKSIIIGIGFLVAAIALAISGIWGGRNWWWAMLFPAIFSLAKGIPDYIKAERMLKSSSQQPVQNFISQPQQNHALPPNQTEYVQSESRYKTGDLVPPSVTDGTTRHLEINSEGETMTLPKKP
jgi:hypothetical protein